MQLVKAGLCAFGMSGKVFHAPFLKEHPGFFISAIVERSKEESKEISRSNDLSFRRGNACGGRCRTGNY